MSGSPFAPDPQTGWSSRLSNEEFQLFRSFFLERIGMHLPDTKQMLVASRLGRRIATLGLKGFGEYHRLLRSEEGREEIQHAVDLITTNETFFFREPEHFQILETTILPSFPAGQFLKAWCAASSTGEEPYTLAMVLHHARGNDHWQLVASDVNSEVLETARKGIYPISRAERIPEALLKAYCRKGIGDYDGSFLIVSQLRGKVEFYRINLLDIPSNLVDLDIVFLRNVLIYFDANVRQELLTRVVSRIRPGGWLVLGHSESLVGLHLPPLHQLKPSVYQKPRGAHP
ncbi:MAG: protein-glutamate O-methyltransferase CheR [Fibrobacteres bacterium]|nr:protein-glutamate O-methyltransferase CheR [Fibrobacterota bacterium]